MSNPDAIWSSDFYQSYVTGAPGAGQVQFTGDLDLIATSKQTASDGSVQVNGTTCRAIENTDTQTRTIVVQRARDGATVALTFQSGEIKVMRASKIFFAGTTTTAFEVYW